MSDRWKFPHAEGFFAREETGEWSSSAFAAEMLDEKFDEVWHQAEPAENNRNPDDWRRWAEYLQTRDCAESVRQVAVTLARRRLSLLEEGRGASTSSAPSALLVPMLTPDDAARYLAKPGHWRRGRSAFELATRWHRANGIPQAVKQVFDASAEFSGATLVQGIFEKGTVLDRFPRQSQTDLLLLLKLPKAQAGNDLAVAAVEGKVDEDFGDIVGERRAKTLPNSNWPARVEGLCRVLEIEAGRAERLRYQLLHRAVAAIIEAKAYGAAHALLVVHSFALNNPAFSAAKGDHFDDLVEFAAALGIQLGGKNTLSDAVNRGGVELRLAWVADSPS